MGVPLVVVIERLRLTYSPELSEVDCVSLVNVNGQRRVILDLAVETVTIIFNKTDSLSRHTLVSYHTVSHRNS